MTITPVNNNNLPDSRFKGHLYDSLAKINALLPGDSFPQLQQEIDALLSTAENPANYNELLFTAIRLKIYALLALTRR